MKPNDTNRLIYNNYGRNYETAIAKTKFWNW